ncbi:MAG: trimethylamine methyltransferase family protein, partial [Desulfohalobiaceae bacterium]|nr:trimethylamine methyltransferase family protein [Desulfohalobiaceae bacterium]
MQSFGLKGGQYQPLNDQQVQTIHEAALRILETTGIGFEKELGPIVDSLIQAGAMPEATGTRLTLPRELVQACLELAPERVVLYSRDGKNDLDLSEDKVHLGTGGAAVKMLDLESGKARPSTLQDLFDIARLVDGLENIHFFLRPCIPTDLADPGYDLNVFYTCFKGTTKHVMAGVNTDQTLHEVLELASMLAGDRQALQDKPFFSVITSFVISPLKL